MSAANVAIIGAGPAGLMAAEAAAQGGAQVDVYDGMPSAGRKFLLAGRGGLNLTHSEPFEPFASRFGERRAQVEPWLRAFGPEQLRAWAQQLGVSTFVGSSGRVFPSEMKAAPLLRAWLHRLRAAGVRLHMRHRWTGWTDAGALRFSTPEGEHHTTPDALVLALGGASWPRLGSDGSWQALLAQRGVQLAPLAPANCGFDVQGGWSEHFASRFAGQPFKSVAIRFSDASGRSFERKGEFVATAGGVEGSLVYAASALLRDEIARSGHATFSLDLLPARSAVDVAAQVSHPRGARSLSSHLKSRLGIEGIKMALLHELLPKEVLAQPQRLAAAIKNLPVTLSAARPIDEAISSAGGVRFDSLDADLMLRELPGVFCAGEMLDWEAPTGGYLLTACMASGRTAGTAAARRG
ncbi:TIGR03862 family flavoprotein [Caenimonas terrae]|uniref:TIGR03862 family flavoprotein n=1 Tax=Caenimonas terrae TaxID=696074 RepID=A0ABW0NE16_9BURK